MEANPCGRVSENGRAHDTCTDRHRVVGNAG